MNKRLLLVRHAKAIHINFNLIDFDRPLTEYGHMQAALMAKRLVKKAAALPQYLVSSPALRAITTATYFAKHLNLAETILQEPAIYEATPSTLLRIINNLDNRYDCIALFGHNPGLTELAILLSNADIDPIPTCGMVSIEFLFDDWQMISGGTGEMKFYDYPK